MRFFQYFPIVNYDITGDLPRQSRTVTDILSRAKILDSIKSQTFIYYQYVVRDGDTPEILAYNYYGNTNRHWIILLANDIVDVFYDWPLNSTNFDKYITKKYGSFSTAQTTYSHYEKVITKLDSVTNTTTVNSYKLDYDTYVSLPSSFVQTINLKDGNSVTITTTKKAVTYFDYEYDLNESKRNIKIIDQQYVPQIENELKYLF